MGEVDQPHDAEDQRRHLHLGRRHQRPARQRRAQHDAQRIGADQQTGSGNRNAQILSDTRQHAHGGEFCYADAKGTDGKCDKWWIDTHGRLLIYAANATIKLFNAVEGIFGNHLCVRGTSGLQR